MAKKRDVYILQRLDNGYSASRIVPELPRVLECLLSGEHVGVSVSKREIASCPKGKFPFPIISHINETKTNIALLQLADPIPTYERLAGSDIETILSYCETFDTAA